MLFITDSHQREALTTSERIENVCSFIHQVKIKHYIRLILIISNTDSNFDLFYYNGYDDDDYNIATSQHYCNANNDSNCIN